MTIKEVLDGFGSSYLFPSFELVDKALLHTRKKIIVYSGVDTQHFYHAVFCYEQKSRFGSKEAEELETLLTRLVLHVKHAYKYKHLLLKAPLCSKALNRLVQNGWKVMQ